MSKLTSRQWVQQQSARKNNHISLKNDSRVTCRRSGRNKFLYTSEIKAKVALRFNVEHGAVRYYICDKCMGYHLTSQTVAEYRQRVSEYLV